MALSTASVCVFLVSLLGLSSVDSFSTGIGGCPAGPGAIFGTGSTHVGDPVDISTLGTTVSLNGVIVNSGDAGSFPIGTDIAWSLDTTNENGMKGILFRVQADNDAYTVASPILPNEVVYCTDPFVSSVSHTESSAKVSVPGTMRFDQAGPVTVDLTIVFANGFDGATGSSVSITGYTQFSFVVGDAVAVTPAPVAVTTESPVATVLTPAPVAVTTESPVATGVTPAPVDAATTESPVAVSTVSPTIAGATAAPTVGLGDTLAPTALEVTTEPVETEDPVETEEPVATEAPEEPTETKAPKGKGEEGGKEGKGDKGDKEDKGTKAPKGEKGSKGDDGGKGKGESEGKGKGSSEGKGKGESEGKGKGSSEGKGKGETEGKGKGSSDGKGKAEKEGKGKGGKEKGEKAAKVPKAGKSEKAEKDEKEKGEKKQKSSVRHGRE